MLTRRKRLPRYVRSVKLAGRLIRTFAIATVFAIVLNVLFLVTLLASGLSQVALTSVDLASSAALAIGVFFWTLRAARAATTRKPSSPT